MLEQNAYQQNKSDKKSVSSWIFFVLGILINLVFNGECCHPFNVEWIFRSIGSVVPFIVIAGIIAGIIDRKNGVKNITFRTFSIAVLIISILFVIGSYNLHNK